MPMTATISTDLIQPHQKQFMRQFVASKIQHYKTPQALKAFLQTYTNREAFIAKAFEAWRDALIANINEFNKTAPDLEPGEVVQFARSALYPRCGLLIDLAIEEAEEGKLEAAIADYVAPSIEASPSIEALPLEESIPPLGAAPINPSPVAAPSPANVPVRVPARQRHEQTLYPIQEEEDDDPDLEEALRLSNQPEPEDPAIAAAIAASLASTHPSPLALRSEDAELDAALAASQAEERERKKRVLAQKEQEERELAEALKISAQQNKSIPQQVQAGHSLSQNSQQPQNLQPPQPLNSQTNLFSSEDLRELERIKTEVKEYIAAYNKKPPRQGTFYGRSDQVSKLTLANNLLSRLSKINSSTNGTQLTIDLAGIYVNINDNKTYTGNALFHPQSVLTKILGDTEKLFTKNLKPLEQLEAYSCGLELTQAQKKTGFFGITSNQKAKHDISNNILKLLNDPSATPAIKIAELKKAIKENRKATGPSWLHGPGKLEDILKVLLMAISPKVRKPGTRLNKKS